MFYIYLSPTVDDAVKDKLNTNLPITNNIENAQGLIILGGDGSLLNALVHLKKIPIIYAINFGSCGILMPFHKQELPSLIEDLKDKKRLPTFKRKRFYMNDTYFINETIITRNQKARLNKYKVYINNEYFDEFLCDSIIVSTPSGSSAYNLSAGGPYVSSDCDVIIITAISPFRTFLRSFVVGLSSKIEITGGETCIIDGCYEIPCLISKIGFENNFAEFAYNKTEESIEKITFNKIFNRN